MEETGCIALKVVMRLYVYVNTVYESKLLGKVAESKILESQLQIRNQTEKYSVPGSENEI